MQQTNKPSRRQFLKWLIGSAVLVELGYVLYGLVGKKKPLQQSQNLFNAGNVSFFEKGRVYPFAGGHFYLSCLNDGGFLALSAKCTHLGCMIQSDLTTAGFACPCHSSKFNEYGEVLSPPATRALDILPILSENGDLLVDFTAPIKRKQFEKDQITYL